VDSNYGLIKVAVTPQGRLYAAGSVNRTADFGGGEHTPTGLVDGFLAEYRLGDGTYVDASFIAAPPGLPG
jgi:hypothetical protein